MNHFLERMESVIGLLSDLIWPVFLPFMLVLGVFISVRVIFVINRRTTRRATLNPKNIIGPASISLGAMIGTGALVGVLGSLSNLVGKGQIRFEAIVFWAVLGAAVMIPVSYSETVSSKVMKRVPVDYISFLLNPFVGVVFAVAFAALYIFGFGGFQFSGIDAVVTIVAEKYGGIMFSQMQRYLYIIIPVLLIVALIVLSRKHSLFIRSMSFMIGIAVVAYVLFFTVFIVRTSDYIPVFFARMMEGVANPTSAMLGMPLGFVLAMQRVLQTAETGLGAMAMAAVESDSDPREAGLISLIPTVITVFIAIFVTTYIASYGVDAGLISYPAETVGRLSGYINTAEKVTGLLGLIVLCLFTVLSAMTTLLGSYFFLNQLFHNRENVNCVIYLAIILCAGTLAVFGFNLVFDAVDLLLFLVAGINMIALTVYAAKAWKRFRRD